MFLQGKKNRQKILSMDKCIFCEIAAKRVKSDIVKESLSVIAFNDVAPQAPVHIVVIPKDHYGKLEDIKDGGIISDVFSMINDLVSEKLAAKGYRVVVNSGPLGGQTVGHVHFHLLSGRQMQWPPG